MASCRTNWPPVRLANRKSNRSRSIRSCQKWPSRRMMIAQATHKRTPTPRSQIPDLESRFSRSGIPEPRTQNRGPQATQAAAAVTALIGNCCSRGIRSSTVKCSSYVAVVCFQSFGAPALAIASRKLKKWAELPTGLALGLPPSISAPVPGYFLKPFLAAPECS